MAKLGESTTISFRLSVDDKNTIMEAALELGMSMSDFMIMKILQEDRLLPIYLNTISRNIDDLDAGDRFYISEQLPANWKIISKRTRKKIIKKVIEQMDDEEIEAEYISTEGPLTSKDLLCKKLLYDIRYFIERTKEDDD